MLQNQKHLFNLPSGLTYLNCAYMSPMLKSVAQVGANTMAMKDNPSVIQPHQFFDNPDQLRKQFAQLIGVQDSNDCAVVPSVSYAMANVAKNLDAGHGHNIIVADEQFPSNMYAWRTLVQENGIELKVVAAPDQAESRGKAWNEAILKTIDSNTRMVALGHVHWADGTLFDLKKIRQRSKEVGALMVIDGTQSIGALPFDVQEFQPDMVVAAGYKWLMGPYSTGVAYYGDYFKDKIPFENSWMHRLGSEDFAGLVNYEDQYMAGSLRFEVGESANFILVPMLTEAIRQLNEWGVANIQQYCNNLTRQTVNELRDLGFSIESDEDRSKHMFGIRLPEGMDMGVLKQRFVDMNIFVSQRGNSVRIAPHLYNTENDMDRLMEGFKMLAHA